jgi:hypothetical protein
VRQRAGGGRRAFGAGQPVRARPAVRERH